MLHAAGMRGVPFLLLLLLVGSACLPPDHFADITDTVARRDLGCPSVFVAHYEDSPWGFRVEGCGQVAYYRCSYGHKSMGHTQCCQRVVSEEVATTTFAPIAPSPYCEDHYQ